MRRTLWIALLAIALASVPAAARPAEPGEPPAERRHADGLEGEAIGYLAIPALLVLIVLVGVLLGVDGEEPDSP